MKKKIKKLAKKSVKKVKKVIKKKPVKKLASAKGGSASGEKKSAYGKLVGKVKHFFSNIDVAVIKFSAPVKLGDEIRIVGGENTDFNQKIKSMQFEHKELKVAKKGKEVGLKVKEKVRDGYRVYKV